MLDVLRSPIVAVIVSVWVELALRVEGGIKLRDRVRLCVILADKLGVRRSSFVAVSVSKRLLL